MNGYVRRTHCFVGEVDHHSDIEAAHRHPAIEGIAQLVLASPSLLADMSRLLLTNVPIVPPQAPRISDIYRNQYGGIFSPEQAKLAQLLDDLYNTANQDTLDTRRGVVLERIVYLAIRTRSVPHQFDEVILNIAKLRFPAHGAQQVNGYSVDVAACLPSQRAVEFYACKLHSEFLDDRELQGLDKVGAHFAMGDADCFTGACVLEREDNLDPDFLDLLEDYPDVLLFPVEHLLKLKSGPA